jgi:hypothetical protein
VLCADFLRQRERAFATEFRQVPPSAVPMVASIMTHPEHIENAQLSQNLLIAERDALGLPFQAMPQTS